MIDFGKISGADQTLSRLAPDIDKHPLLWGPVLSGQATYKEVFIDDAYDLVDLDRMNSAKQYKDAVEAYNQHVIQAEAAKSRVKN